MSRRSWGGRRAWAALLGALLGALAVAAAAGPAARGDPATDRVPGAPPIQWEVAAEGEPAPIIPFGGCPVGAVSAFLGSALAWTADFPFREPQRVFRLPGEASPEVVIVIEHAKLRLTLYEDGQPVATYPVALGRPGSPSPVGEFRVIQKFIPFRAVFGTRWMRISVPWGNYGIHGTNAPQLIGSRVSAGCIRMNNKHVNALYPRVPIGVLVVLRGPLRVRFRPVYQRRSMGQDVVAVQLMLRAAGFDPGDADGRFGPATEAALARFEQHYGLLPDGRLARDEMALLTD